MEHAELIWIDMTVTTRHGEVDSQFQKHFSILHSVNSEHPERDPALESGAALCFDYDYPDRTGLAVLCRVKEQFPHLPILMLTAQHSEQLAVWAYRNGVLDYFVKPVAANDLLRCKEILLAVQLGSSGGFNRFTMENQPEYPAEIPATPRTTYPRLAPAIRYVQQNFRHKIRNADVAERCRMSAFHFSHEFTDTYKLTFQEYILRYRIFEACKELQHPNVPVANVAYSVGFNDPSYFSRIFRRFIDLSPSEYVEQVTTAQLRLDVDQLCRDLGLPDIDNASAEQVEFDDQTQRVRALPRMA